MKAGKKVRFVRMSFLLNGLLFIFEGIGLLDDDKLILGILQVVAGVFNLLMLRKIKNKRTKDILEYAILLMNIVVALAVAFDYFRMGKSYIQYMWLAAAAMSTIALIIHIRKKSALSKKEV